MKTAMTAKKNKENKSEIITLRVTEQHRNEIENKASEMGLGISACLSHILADYANLKNESQQSYVKMIEATTQKEAMEQALQKAKLDSRTLANPAFTELFESLVGKEVDGKLINSKYDLLSILASKATITKLVDDELDVSIPLEAKSAPSEMGALEYPLWQIALTVLAACVLVATITYAVRPRSRS